MAHVERRRPHAWRARYRGPDGREHSRTFSKKSDADAFLATQEAAKLRGEWMDPALGKTLVSDWAQRWFDTTVHLKPKTRVGYDSLLRNQVLPEFGKYRLASIKPIDVKEWVATMTADGLSASRVRQAHGVLGSMMRAAVESGYISRSPCVGTALPRLPKSDMLFLDAAEVEQLVDAVDPRYRTMIYVLAYGGLRWGEVIALRRARFSPLRARLEVAESLADVNGQLISGPTKTYQHREIALPRFLRDELGQHVDSYTDTGSQALIFTGRNGAPLRHAYFTRRVWRPAVEAA